MADIKALYIDLIKDYDPYADMAEHENLSNSDMLYNLIEIREAGLETIDDDIIVDRFNKLIDLFEAYGISPYYDYQN